MESVVKKKCPCGNFVKESRSKYCSYRCSAINRWKIDGLRDRARISMLKENRKQKITKKCSCGEEFTRANTKYCSKKCFYKYRINKTPPNFKGDNVGYDALHDWVNLHKGKASKCEFCDSCKNVHWANKSHNYKRDLNDFISLCVKCHRKYDKESVGAKKRRFSCAI